MARGINKVILVGNLGQDPETRYMSNGKAVTNLRLATSESWKDKQTGEQREQTEWHSIVMYDKLADAYKGVVRVQVRSAWPLADGEKARLKGDLDRITGKNCTIESSVDRALVGGLQVRIGDSVVDGTVAHRLKALKERLQELQKR